MYFETFVVKLRLIRAAGLTIVNKEIVQSLFVFAIWLFKGKSKYGPSGN